MSAVVATSREQNNITELVPLGSVIEIVGINKEAVVHCPESLVGTGQKIVLTSYDFPNDDDNTLLNIANEFGINMDDIIKLEKCIILWLILSNKIRYRIINLHCLIISAKQ